MCSLGLITGEESHGRWLTMGIFRGRYGLAMLLLLTLLVVSAAYQGRNLLAHRPTDRQIDAAQTALDRIPLPQGFHLGDPATTCPTRHGALCLSTSLAPREAATRAAAMISADRSHLQELPQGFDIPSG
jgi:hypothetical protein